MSESLLSGTPYANSDSTRIGKALDLIMRRLQTKKSRRRELRYKYSEDTLTPREFRDLSILVAREYVYIATKRYPNDERRLAHLAYEIVLLHRKSALRPGTNISQITRISKK